MKDINNKSGGYQGNVPTTAMEDVFLSIFRGQVGHDVYDQLMTWDVP